MGLFDGGRTQEDKNLEKIARALDEMRLKEPDGLLHAGCFGVSMIADAASISMVLDGVLEFLQKNGREIVDVKPSANSGSGNSLFTVLYK